MPFDFDLQGDWVWIQPAQQDNEFEIPLGARILRTDPGKVLVRYDQGPEEWVAATRVLKGMHLTSQTGVEDMITLGDLHEHSILRNLFLRYHERQIYVSYIEPMR